MKSIGSVLSFTILMGLSSAALAEGQYDFAEGYISLEDAATTGNCRQFANEQKNLCNARAHEQCRVELQQYESSEEYSQYVGNCVDEKQLSCSGLLYSQNLTSCSTYSSSQPEPEDNSIKRLYSEGCPENYTRASTCSDCQGGIEPELKCVPKPGEQASGPIDPMSGRPIASSETEEGIEDEGGLGNNRRRTPAEENQQASTGSCPAGCYDGEVRNGVQFCEPRNGGSQVTLQRARDQSSTLCGGGLSGSAVEPELAAVNESAVNGDLRRRYNESCEPRKDRAETCCGDSPASCVSEAFNTDKDKANIGVQALNVLAQGSMAMSGSIGQLCGRMGTVAKGATAINLALGATCSRMVGICKRECGQLLDDLEAKKAQLISQASSENITLRDDNLSGINKIIDDAKDAVNTCKTADNGTVRAAMSAFASFQAAKMSDMCKTQAGADLDNIGTNSFDVDCSAPGAAANPVCQAQCQRPGAENDPICQTILQNLNGGANTAVNFNTNGDGSDDDSFDVGGLDDEEQLVNIGDIEGGPSGLSSASPGGGGGLAGGGGGGGGGAGPAAAGGSARNRTPSSILKGTNSGNGYTRSSLRSGARGGYRGPASSGKGVYKKGKKFSLKDFLPGGKANPKRGLAGFSRGNPEIGAKTDDLFNRITARFYEICLKNRLYDCKTITNRKRGR